MTTWAPTHHRATRAQMVILGAVRHQFPPHVLAVGVAGGIANHVPSVAWAPRACHDGHLTAGIGTIRTTMVP